MILDLIKGATTPVVGSAVALGMPRDDQEFTVQFAISGAATVRLFGRLSPGLPFVQILEVSTSQLAAIAKVHEVYAQVVSLSSGTVDVAAKL